MIKSIFFLQKNISIIIITIIYLIPKINSYYCGSWLPKDQSSCEIYNTNSTLCCYLTTFSNGIYFNMCYQINMTDYLHLNNKISLGGYDFDVDCGTIMGTTCGTINTPQSYKDCSQFSLNTNSCCYYRYKNDSSCVWLGQPYTGRVEYKGLELFCSENFISLKRGWFLHLLLFLFLYNFLI